MNYSNINEADSGIDIDNLNYNDYVKLRMKSQSMKGMDKAEKAELFKIIGKEWKSLKDLATKRKSGTKNESIQSIRDTVRNELYSVLTEWNDDWGDEAAYYDGLADEDRFYDDETLREEMYESYKKDVLAMFKFMDDNNEIYTSDYLLTGVFEGYEITDIFNPDNRELMNYYKTHAKNIKTNKFNDELYLLSDYQNGQGGYEESTGDPTLTLSLEVMAYIPSGFIISELFNECGEIEEGWNYTQNEPFIFDYGNKNTDESRCDALLTDVNEWFIKNENNIIKLIEKFNGNIK